MQAHQKVGAGSALGWTPSLKIGFVLHNSLFIVHCSWFIVIHLRKSKQTLPYSGANMRG